MARGEAFLAKLRAFCETEVDGRLIEREARIPDEVVNGLKELGALGMKIDTKYGGLGLTQVYYNKALTLAGSASPAIGALLSAHQSIGVPQPLKLFGTQEQKDTFLPRCARTDISAFLLTEPDVGSDPARLATSAVPDGDDYVLDGVKLWTTNGVVADLLVVMARVPKSEGHKGGITAFVVEADSPGVTVENRNAFMGLRGIENGVTRFHQVRVPAANRIGPEGSGLKIALTTLNTGRLSLPAMCVGSGKWCLKIAREWSGVREQWGRPVARHEAVGAKISFIAATTFALEADDGPLLADGRRGPQRHPHRGGPRQAVRLRDGLADGGRTGPDPRRPRLRDRRLAGRPRRARRPRRADAPRHADQPDLRGLDRDHAPADRPRGGRRPPLGGRRPHRPRQVPPGQGEGGCATRPGSTPSGCPSWSRARANSRAPTASSGRLAQHLRYAERAARKLARSTFYAMSRWQGRMETKQGFLGRIVDIGAELFAMSAACVRAEHLRTTGDHGREAVQLADAFCRQSRIRVEELFTRLWSNTDDLDRKVVEGVLGRCLHLAGGGRHRPLRRRPLDRGRDPGPGQARTTSTGQFADSAGQLGYRSGRVRSGARSVIGANSPAKRSSTPSIRTRLSPASARSDSGCGGPAALVAGLLPGALSGRTADAATMGA